MFEQSLKGPKSQCRTWADSQTSAVFHYLTLDLLFEASDFGLWRHVLVHLWEPGPSPKLVGEAGPSPPSLDNLKCCRSRWGRAGGEFWKESGKGGKSDWISRRRKLNIVLGFLVSFLLVATEKWTHSWTVVPLEGSGRPRKGLELSVVSRRLHQGPFCYCSHHGAGIVQGPSSAWTESH